jgi:hypothetical protein
MPKCWGSQAHPNLSGLLDTFFRQSKRGIFLEFVGLFLGIRDRCQESEQFAALRAGGWESKRLWVCGKQAPALRLKDGFSSTFGAFLIYSRSVINLNSSVVRAGNNEYIETTISGRTSWVHPMVNLFGYIPRRLRRTNNTHCLGRYPAACGGIVHSDSAWRTA